MSSVILYRSLSVFTILPHTMPHQSLDFQKAKIEFILKGYMHGSSKATGCSRNGKTVSEFWTLVWGRPFLDQIHFIKLYHFHYWLKKSTGSHIWHIAHTQCHVWTTTLIVWQRPDALLQPRENLCKPFYLLLPFLVWSYFSVAALFPSAFCVIY